MDNQSATSHHTAFIDHLRLFLTIAVIMHHAAITFGAQGGWYCFEARYSDLPFWQQVFFQILTSTNQAFFMGFFFLIAGYFTPASLERKGVGTFLRDRVLRLGVPLLLFAGLLAPVTIGMAQVVKGESFSDGFRWVYAMRHFECGPMWFVQALLIFAVIYVLWILIFPPRKTSEEPVALPCFGILLCGVVATGFFAFALRQFFPIGVNIAGMQLGYFATYIVLFFAGCRAAKDRWLERVEFRTALTWSAIALAAIAILPVAPLLLSGDAPWSGGWNCNALFYAMWEPFVALGVILGLLYLVRRYFAGTNPFLKHLARCSFAVYFVHAPVLVGLTLLLHGWTAAPFTKWLVVGPLACVVSWLVATVIVKTPGLRRIF